MMEFFQTKSYGRGIADFDEFIQKKSHITLRSCLVALCFDPNSCILTTNIPLMESLLDNWRKNNHITIDIIYYLRSLLVHVSGIFKSFSFLTYFSTALIIE